MHEVLIVIAVVAVLAITVIKRFRGEPLVAKDLFIGPLIMLAIGAYMLKSIVHWTTLDVTWLGLSLIIGLLVGAVRGTTTVLFIRVEVLHQRYTIRTLLVWIASLGVSFLLGFAGSMFGTHPNLRPIPLSIGIGLLGEMITTGTRALSTGKPFGSPERGDRQMPALDRTIERLQVTPSNGDLAESPGFRDALRKVIEHQRT